LPGIAQRAAVSESGAGRAGPLAVRIDGRGLTPAGVAAVACEGAAVELAPEAAARNRAAAEAVAAILARGDPLYGVTTGVGVLRTRGVEGAERPDMQLRLLRSHAGGGGALLAPDVVRAAMVVRANQLGAGGAGVSPALLAALVAAVNAGIVPAARELGSLGTGDVSVLAEIALVLLGEGAVLAGSATAPAHEALTRAGLSPPVLGVRDGIGFMSSNAATIGQAALVAEHATRVLDTALTVAALSFTAAGADVGVLDARVHAARPHPEQMAVAERMRALVGHASPAGPRLGRPVHDPYGFRCQPQVDGPTWAALARLRDVLAVELNAAAENALVVADDGVALPNGNFHAGVLGLAVDNLCAALAQSASLVAARVGALLDATVTGLPAMLAERPGADSGAMMLEYTAHAAAADLRALTAPSSAGYVSVSAGVEAHGGLAAQGAARASAAVARMADTVAVELVAAVRAFDLGGRPAPADGKARSLLAAAHAVLARDVRDRPLSGDVAAARAVVVAGVPHSSEARD
jgi:histidine ammonia-lyase